jgi:hypothetical protein
MSAPPTDRTGLELMRAIASGELPPPPVAVLLGFGIDRVDEGNVVFSSWRSRARRAVRGDRWQVDVVYRHQDAVGRGSAPNRTLPSPARRPRRSQARARASKGPVTG